MLHKFPDHVPRMETGLVQWGEDWPGVFIRGDNAMNYSYALRRVIDAAQHSKQPDPIMVAVVNGLAVLLESCDLHNESRR